MMSQELRMVRKLSLMRKMAINASRMIRQIARQMIVNSGAPDYPASVRPGRHSGETRARRTRARLDPVLPSVALACVLVAAEHGVC